MPLERLQKELEGRAMPADDARLLAHLAGGRLGYALRLKEDPNRMDQRRAFIEDLINMLGANRRERFTYAETIVRDREALREAYQVWLSFWRDLMLRCASPDLPLINLDMEVEINNLSAQVSLPAARAQVSALEQGIARLEGNLNARLLTEVLLLDWPHVSFE
jgi:DNA polymerase-3 subunit delta'